MNLQSFADGHCSGKTSCEIVLTISDLVKKNIRPCPLELSSYLEASFICIPGILQVKNTITFIFCEFAQFCRWILLWENIMWNEVTCQWSSKKQHPTLPIRTKFIPWSKLCLYTRYMFNYYIFDLVILQSFADAACSGKGFCEFHIAEIWMKDIKPCPPELSSYFEASFVCLKSKLISKFTSRLISFCKVLQTSPALGKFHVSSMSISWCIERNSHVR